MMVECYIMYINKSRCHTCIHKFTDKNKVPAEICSDLAKNRELYYFVVVHPNGNKARYKIINFSSIDI